MSKKYWIAKHPEVAVEPTDTDASEADQELSVKNKLTGLKSLAEGMETAIAAGTGSGSAGEDDVEATKVMKVTIDGTPYYIPLYTANA
jgi:hypothetical protein